MPEQETQRDREISENLIVSIDLFSWEQQYFRVSLDSRRVAYGAQKQNKWVIVVNGKEGRQYDSLLTGNSYLQPR